MSKNQMIAAGIVLAWAAYQLGKRSGAACSCKSATAVATVSTETWDWLNSVRTM